jgi:CRISPR/Cas system CSM-associated protein Csm5 (group 7 of RAMP superfamily)
MKQKIDQSILLEIEIASPLHVGAAAEQHWQEGVDFFAHEGVTYVISLDNLSKEIEIDQLSNMLSTKNTRAILNRVKSKLGSLAYKTFETKVSTEINRHTFSGFDGKPYLPSSSLKGAIRSVLLTYFLKESGLRSSEYKEQKLIGGFENSVMRFLQFADVPFQDSVVVNSKIFNLQHNNEGGWKNGGNKTNDKLEESSFNTFYECIDVGATGFTTFSYRSEQANNLINASMSHENKTNSPPKHTLPFFNSFSFENVFKIINDHTIKYLGKEIAFFEKYQFDDTSRIMCESLKYLKEKAEGLDDTKACMLRMAAGSGFHSITGDWQYDDFINTGTHNGGRNHGKQKYKSRKVALFTRDNIRYAEPLGFIILRKTSHEELLAQENAVLAGQATAETQEAERLETEQKAEAARIETERLAAEEAKKPQMLDASPTNGLEVDAVVTQSKPTKVNIYLKGHEKKHITMSECAAMPIGYICTVRLVVKKKNIERVIHIAPK